MKTPAVLTLTHADLMAAVGAAARQAVADFLASNEAEKIRAALLEEATCVSAEEVGAMWRMTPRAAREALKKLGVPVVDLGHRTPRYRLQAVTAALAKAKSPRARVRIINNPDHPRRKQS